MPRPRKSEQEVAVKRERILDAAFAILNEQGPHAVTTRAIARRLGIAHMSLYQCFDSQPAILAALRNRELARWQARLRKLAQQAGKGEILPVIRKMLAAAGAFARRHPQAYRLAWVMPEALGETPQATQERMSGTVMHLAGVLDLAMNRGAIARRDPRLAAALALGIVNMPYILFLSGKLQDAKLRERMAKESLIAAMAWLQQQPSRSPRRTPHANAKPTRP